jgi:type IV secretory pathway VirB4 component
MENANVVVFGKSGGGKSYMVKLEVLRSLMFGTEVIIIDPENEYEEMCQAVGGEFITFSFNSNTKVNPFDLSQLTDSGENELGLKILGLHALFKVIMGQLTPEEDAVLDRALVLTYKQKGITQDPTTQKLEPPLMEDLYKVLLGMEESVSKGLADRIEKFIKGSLVGIINQQSNIEIKNPFTVFSIRDLADELRPIAMQILLDFIWTKVRRDVKKRILVVDEAWYLMKHADSANFLNSIAKRARKYYLGLTTITQDVEDFLAVDLGKAIVQNSSMQILLKQSAAAIDRVAEIFYLSEGEKHLLLSADVGEGLFFAGPAHVSLRIISSPDEHKVITTNPEELASRRNVPSKPSLDLKNKATGVNLPPPNTPPPSLKPIPHE